MLVILLFIAGLCAPLIGVRIRSHGWDIASRAENRKMADEPALFRLHDSSAAPSMSTRLKALAKFPGEFKYYLSEHFGFRSLLIRTHGTLMVKGLGVTSNSAVILGKDGWLYLANDGSLEDWRNSDPFTPEQLEQWRHLLEARSEYCTTRGIRYLFVLAPSKYDIYPEYMPESLNQVRRESRLDQLLAYLRQKQSPVNVLDLRPALLEAKKNGVRLYQKTDTHWNDRGAWVAYQAIVEAVQKQIPGVLPLSSDDMQPVTTERPGMDLAGLLGLNELYREESLDLVSRIPLRLPHVVQDKVEPITVEADETPKPRIVMFRDSFMTAVLPFIAQDFGRGVYFWEDGFDQKVIEAEHPDIVIQEMAQRKLMLPASDIEKILPVKLDAGKWELEHPVR